MATEKQNVDEMLKTWSRTRDPALADAIEAANPTRWAQLFKTTAGFKKGLALGRIARLPTDDPRVTVFLIDCLHRARWPGPTAQPLWASVFKKLVELKDVRAVASLREAAAQPPPILGAPHAAWLKATLLATADAIEKKGARKVTTTIATFGPRKPAKALSPAVTSAFSSTTDDASLMVLSDALLERGEAWGELIRLQTQTGPGGKDRAAQAPKLISKHLAEFAGAVALVARNRQSLIFEKGFLTEVSVGGQRPRPAWERSVTAEHWSTVRALRLRLGTPVWWLTALANQAPFKRLLLIECNYISLQRKQPTDFFTAVTRHRAPGRLALKWAGGVIAGLSPEHRQSLAESVTNADIRAMIHEFA